MKRFLLSMTALAVMSLACGQQIVTPTPEPTPTASPQPAATLSPTAPPTASATEAEQTETATVRAALVNVRAEPGGEVVGQLTAGTDVRVIGCEGDWCEIEADEASGFVFIGCLSVDSGKGCIADE